MADALQEPQDRDLQQQASCELGEGEREGGREGGGGREKEEEGRGKNGEERIAKFGIFYIFCILIWCLG